MEAARSLLRVLKKEVEAVGRSRGDLLVGGQMKVKVKAIVKVELGKFVAS